MPKSSLGQLKRLSAMEAFANEPSDFTPWLADNLSLLADELGLDLQLRAREHQVGRYYLDLLLDDPGGRVVIVENQFNRTDHTHLGQLLTYCAGTHAQVVIWIAEKMTEEHAAALEWLNENTLPGVGFFGVELEVLRIDDSPMAPHFKVVVQPNDWSKTARAETQQAVVSWDWDAYRQQLQVAPGKLAIGEYLATLIESEIRRRDLKWRQRFNKGYVAFQRDGGYNVVVVDFWWNRIPRLKVKLPAPPASLNDEDPLPNLESGWDPQYKEWWWAVPALDSVDAAEKVVDLAARHQPAAGAMPGL